MNICICDDEVKINSQIKEFITIFGDYNINTFTNEKDLEVEMNSNNIDVLFMDIKLKNINGIDFIKNNEDKLKNTKIVYITGYSEYIEDVFETNPIYFLQKPVTKDKIEKVLNKVNKLNSKENNYLLVAKNNEMEKIYFRDILFIESYARLLIIHLANGKNVETYNKLSEIIKELPSKFIKIHKSYIINLEHVINYKVNRVILSNNDELPISRLNKEQVKKEIMRFISK